MPRLRVLSRLEIRKILEANGFEFVRQKGSHMIMRRALPSAGFSLPIPKHREVSKSTLFDIIVQSGLPRELFEEQS